VTDAVFEVLLFGPAREAGGSDRVPVRVDGPATAAQVLAALERAHPALAPFLPRARVAVNRRYVDTDAPVVPGDEIAVIPPVGGG
jgi:molybdopterin converting factor small subunit